MPIDWFTVIAQAVNFLILVWLLQRFLYKPILHAIDQREKGIANQLAEAEAKQVEAEKQRDDLERKNTAFDQERAALLKKATDEANAERQKLLEQARQDADTLRAKRQEALQNEQRKLSQEIIRWTQKEVFAIARKTLADLANTSIEQRMGEVFVQRLLELNGEAKEQLAAAIRSGSGPACVRSAFELPPAQRSAIEIAIKETFATKTPVRFETTPELVSGIELSGNGQKVGWNIADYLATLEKSAGQLVLDDAQPESKPKPKSPPAAETKPLSKTEPKHKPEPEPSAPKADH